MLRAPFPWFGGKSRVAAVVWRAFGDVPNYVEPFAGSLAVLLGRPHAPKIETVNDLDCYIANFWRAVRADPFEVARWCDWPVNEADLSARHQWLVDRVEFRERMAVDPDYYDAKIAGWWVWGISCWIGAGWCAAAGRADVSPARQLPHLGNAGRGVHRKLPHLGNAGRGVHRRLPHLSDAGQGVHRKLLSTAGQGVHSRLPHIGSAGRGEALVAYFEALAARLRNVRVACGSWERVVTDSVTWRHGTTGVFLDPPYDDGEIDYAVGRRIAQDVAAWAREHGDDERLRIALCGYEGDYDLPGWTVYAWTAHGGYAGQRKDGSNDNRHRERIWFSPHCLAHERQRDLFAHLTEAAE